MYCSYRKVYGRGNDQDSAGKEGKRRPKDTTTLVRVHAKLSTITYFHLPGKPGFLVPLDEATFTFEVLVWVFWLRDGWKGKWRDQQLNSNGHADDYHDKFTRSSSIGMGDFKFHTRL